MIGTALRQEFEAALGRSGVISDPAELRTYECDGLTGYRVVPALVVLPESTEQVAAAVRLCAREQIPFVARGAGTGLSGGAVPVADGIVISLGQPHSFPLETVFGFVPSHQAKDVLIQALLDRPMFEIRWRWNVTRAP